MEFKLANLTLNYEIIGTGTPFLMLHGLGCDMHLMQGCMEPALASTNQFQRIYVDLPGMGHSNAPLAFASSDAILDALITFTNAIITKPFLVAGESFGGYLALGLAAKLPTKVTKALLICPMVEPNHDSRDVPTALTYQEVDESFMATVDPEVRENFLSFITVANKNTFNRFEAEIMVGLRQGNHRFLDQLATAYAYSFDLFKTLTTNPVHPDILFLLGRQDQVVGYKDAYRLSQLVPRVSYFIFDKASHSLQIEQPTLFNSVVNGWLA